MQHRFIKSLALQLDRRGHSEKKTKVVSIEHKKQKLSLENNQRRCYNDVYKSKTVLFLPCMHAKLKGFSCLR